MAFVIVCAYGLLIALKQLIETRVASEPWWVGVVLLAMVVGGCAFVVGLWLYGQTEVTFTGRTVVVRRWIAAMFGRPGREVAIEQIVRSTVSIERGRFHVERDGHVLLDMQVFYWGRKQVLALVRTCEDYGIHVEVRWSGAARGGA